MEYLIWLLLLSSLRLSCAGLVAPDNVEHSLSTRSQVVLLDAVLPALDSPSNTAPTFPQLDPLIQKYRLPGLTAAWSDGEALHSQVAGMRKASTFTPIMPTDQFHIGSLGKAMTATLMAILVKDGYFSWDSKLEDLFPDLVDDIAAELRGTTLKMLTSHRSGIFIESLLHPELSKIVLDYSLSPKDGRSIAMKYALSVPPANAPGTFKYENMNFIIAGALVDRYTAYTYEEMLRTCLWDPLQMQGCGFGPNEEHSETSVDNPWPHQPNPLPGLPPIPVYLPYTHRDIPPAFNSAGRVHCTMESYNHFLLLHARALSGHENVLGLSQSDFEVLHTPYSGPDNATPYTPGAWSRANTTLCEDGYALHHEGSNTMNQAIAWVDVSPSCFSTMMTMTNVGGDEADEGTRAVMAKLRGTS